MEHEKGLMYFPIGMFAGVMGLAGLSLVWHKCEMFFGAAHVASAAMLAAAYLLMLAVGGTYLLKFIRHGAAVRAEFDNPVKMNFFPAISIGLLLLGIGTLEYNRLLSQSMWVLGAGSQLLFTLVIMVRWLTRSFAVVQLNPAWFIPVVGNILVPICGVEFAGRELSWFLFTVGLVFWVLLFGMNFYRLIFEAPLPNKLLPTLGIFLAPPGAGCVAYLRLAGEVDGLARILLYLTYILVAVLLYMAPRFLRLPYFVSWWAYTFPLCAATLASFGVAGMLGSEVMAGISLILAALSTVVVLTVAARTMQAAMAGELLIKED